MSPDEFETLRLNMGLPLHNDKEVERERIRAEALKQLSAETDRSVGVLAAAIVEEELRIAICANLHGGDPVSIKWLMRDDGPINTFGSLIHLGSALNLYGKEGREALWAIKNIRNRFAHRMYIHSFDHPDIASLKGGLKYPSKHLKMEGNQVVFNFSSAMHSYGVTFHYPEGYDPRDSLRELYMWSCGVVMNMLANCRESVFRSRPYF